MRLLLKRVIDMRLKFLRLRFKTTCFEADAIQTQPVTGHLDVDVFSEPVRPTLSIESKSQVGSKRGLMAPWRGCDVMRKIG